MPIPQLLIVRVASCSGWRYLETSKGNPRRVLKSGGHVLDGDRKRSRPQFELLRTGLHDACVWFVSAC